MRPVYGWHMTAGGPQAALAASIGARASYHKTATGPVGLAVNPNAREDFIKQQKEILEKIEVRGIRTRCVDSWAGFTVPGRPHCTFEAYPTA